MGYFLSFLLVALMTSSAQASTTGLVLKSNAWTKQDRCLTDLLNALPVSGGRVKGVTFPSVNRNPFYKLNIGDTATMEGRMGLAKRRLSIKMKAAPGSSFYKTIEGSKYYSFDYFRSVVFDAENGTLGSGEAECTAEVFQGFDAYPVATIDICRCLPMP